MFIERINSSDKIPTPSVEGIPVTVSVYGPNGIVYAAEFVSWLAVLECVSENGSWSILRVGDDVRVFAPADYSLGGSA